MPILMTELINTCFLPGFDIEILKKMPLAEWSRVVCGKCGSKEMYIEDLKNCETKNVFAVWALKVAWSKLRCS